MITLKESILGKTKDKIKDTAKCMDVIEREQKNLPTIHQFYPKHNEWWIEWRCPNLIQLALDSIGRFNNPLLSDPVGFKFHFAKDGNCIYPMTLNERGMMFPLMGWGKFEIVDGNDNHRKKVIIDIIKKLSDIDNMAKVFKQYNDFCFRKNNDGMCLLNDL